MTTITAADSAANSAANSNASTKASRTRARRLQRLVTTKATFAAMLLAKLPLAAFAGMRVERLDGERCEVSLPSGWRTQNPFGSMYFAAQAMAAEASTGMPALWFIEESGVSVASLVTGISAQFTKKGSAKATFGFEGGAEMRVAIEKAAASDEPVVLVAKSVGTQKGKSGESEVIARFEITWSFKRRAKRSQEA